MIVVNENGKTLIKVGSWVEMHERVGFQRTADPKFIRLVNIIGWYSLDEVGPCGLTSCRTPHLRGYIVDLGGGTETNLGNICGHKHFGVVFTQLKDAFHVELNAQRFRENIVTRQAMTSTLLARLKHLREGEYQADDCYRKMKRQMSVLFDEKTSRALKRKAERNDNQIVRSVALTADEKAMRLGFDRLSEYRDELVGVVNGIQAASTFARLSPKRLEEIQAQIEVFAGLDAETLSYNQLQTHTRWSNRIEAEFNELDSVLRDCQRFLVPENIARINAQKYNLHRS